MKYRDIEKNVDGVPYISKSNSKVLYDFIIKNKCKNILELGIAHGTASCYIAGALAEVGGQLICVDLESVKEHFQPSAEEQLGKLGLNKYVKIHRMKTGYNWFLHNEIKKLSNNKNNVCTLKYDLVIIDGPKNWTIDSSSFFLVDKVLKENGWIIWDDYNWNYAGANKSRDSTDGIMHNSLSEDELKLPHIKEIFELLVMQHPNYGNFIIEESGDWVWAQKIKENKVN